MEKNEDIYVLYVHFILNYYISKFIYIHIHINMYDDLNE